MEGQAAFDVARNSRISSRIRVGVMTSEYKTLRVRYQGPICFAQLYRPEANNTINDQLIEECLDVLDRCDVATTVVVFEGLPEVFCFGADFTGIRTAARERDGDGSNRTAA